MTHPNPVVYIKLNGDGKRDTKIETKRMLKGGKGRKGRGSRPFSYLPPLFYNGVRIGWTEGEPKKRERGVRRKGNVFRYQEIWTLVKSIQGGEYYSLSFLALLAGATHSPFTGRERKKSLGIESE